ncbi:lipase secretion chaperone [Massilia sp. W12]|uniref:lipase secretion chaperone n=1 Tax=Massilia sp. W12 TaxID=3126507 RepID=UPI0030CD58BD
MMKRSTLAFTTLGLLIGAVGGLYYLGSQTEESTVPRAPQDPYAFVRSLEGTRTDGDLKTGPGDDLVLDAELTRMFDYYLSALGEKPLPAIIQQTELELSRKLSPKAAAQARRLFANYLDYKRALIALDSNPQYAANQEGKQAAALRARFQAMQAARSRFFSASESKALFGFTDAYDLDAIARIEVSEDKQLNAQQKQDKLAQIDAAMPPALREEREAPLRIARAEEQVTQMRAQGASEQQIYQFRAATFSPQAAARLAEVDREEEQWKQRIADFLQQRARLLAGPGDEAGKLAALQTLRESKFSAQELPRLVAYEQ